MESQSKNPLTLKERMELEKMTAKTEQVSRKALGYLKNVQGYSMQGENMHAYMLILKEIVNNKHAFMLWTQIEKAQGLFFSRTAEITKQCSSISKFDAEQIARAVAQDRDNALAIQNFLISELYKAIKVPVEEKLANKTSKMTHDEQQAMITRLTTTSAEAVETLQNFGFTEQQITFIVNDLSKKLSDQTNALDLTTKQVDEEDHAFGTVSDFIKNIRNVKGYDDAECRNMYSVLLSYIERSNRLVNQISADIKNMKFVSKQKMIKCYAATESNTPRAEVNFKALMSSMFSTDEKYNDKNRKKILEYASYHGINLNDGYVKHYSEKSL